MYTQGTGCSHRWRESSHNWGFVHKWFVFTVRRTERELYLLILSNPHKLDFRKQAPRALNLLWKLLSGQPHGCPALPILGPPGLCLLFYPFCIPKAQCEEKRKREKIRESELQCVGLCLAHPAEIWISYLIYCLHVGYCTVTLTGEPLGLHDLNTNFSSDVDLQVRDWCDFHSIRKLFYIQS